MKIKIKPTTYSQTLRHRPFDINDGERYLIVTQARIENKAYTRSYKNKPIFSTNFKDAKIFKDKKTIENCIKVNFIKNNIEYKLFQFDRLLEKSDD